MRHERKKFKKSGGRGRGFTVLAAVSVLLIAGGAVALLVLCGRMKELERMVERLTGMEVIGVDRRTDYHFAGALSVGDGDGTEACESETYADRCGLDYVERPRMRSRREVSDRLKSLAEDSKVIGDIYQKRSRYPDKLLEALANNPEMADFVSRWKGIEETASGGLTDLEMEQEFPLFLQWDPRWGYVGYGDKSCIGLSGCGPTCLAMALYYLTGDESFTPDWVGAYSMREGFYMSGQGTAWALMETLPYHYGIFVSQPGASEEGIKTALDRGAVIILSMGPGEFTSGGHFIVLYGYDEEGFLINDPNCVARSRKVWAYSEFGKEIKHVWVLSNSGVKDESGGVMFYQSP